jgi:myo-inositol-1(or 4)-monophosphatase
MAFMITTQLINIVKDCRELFLEGYHAQKNVKYKGTVDLVTEYDVAIEKRLTATLQKAFPDFTVVGEESTKEMTHPKKAIYVDPIDGTTNFVHGLPFCAISVGMWEDGKPLAGVVYNPVLDECFTAEKGKGAFLNGEKISVSKQTDFQQSLIATGFPYTKVEKGKDYEWVLRTMANLLPITRDIRRGGSAAIDLCYVACGKFEAYYECNLKPWDVAAGLLIVQEAGGKISNEKGEEYNLDEHIIASSNGFVHGDLVEHIG